MIVNVIKNDRNSMIVVVTAIVARVTILYIFIFSIAHADSNSIGIVFSASGENDDNHQLSNETPETLKGRHTTARLKYAYKQVASDYWINVRASDANYNIETYDSVSTETNIGGSRRFEKRNYSLSAGTSIQPTRATELDETGNSLISISNRNKYNSVLSFSQLLDEKNSLAANISGTAVRYENEAFADYDYYSSLVTHSLSYNETTTFKNYLSISKYTSSFNRLIQLPESKTVEGINIRFLTNQEIGTSSIKSESIDVRTGIDFKISRNCTFDGLFGVSTTKTTQTDESEYQTIFSSTLRRNVRINYAETAQSRETLPSLELNLKFNGYVNSFNLGAEKTLIPGSNSSLIERDAVKLTYSRRLSTDVRFSFASSVRLSAPQNENLETNTTFSSNTYFYTNFGLSKTYRNYFRITFDAIYRKLDRDDFSVSPQSRIAKLTLTYTPETYHW